jgi:predicted nucleic acid-binding protein
MGPTERLTVGAVLANVSRLGLDTPPVIYFVEENPRYIDIVAEIFGHISRRELIGITSVVTLGEVLVQPLVHRNLWLQQEYRNLLLRAASFQTLSIDPETAEEAARLRARYRLRMADAMQLATAIRAGCQAFLTNDMALLRVTEIRVVVLDQLGV